MPKELENLTYSNKQTSLNCSPKISVIIPVFNAEHFLQESLDSVLSQTLKEIEIICINDCSTDSSLDILIEYQQFDSRIKVINSSKNLHAGPCRNIGLDICTGEYIHFFDADDILEPNSYKQLYEQAKLHDVDILRCKAYEFNNVTQEISEDPYVSLQNVPNEIFDKVINFLNCPKILSTICVAPWAGLYRKSFLKKEKIRFNSLLCVNDRSFYAQTIFKAQKILISPIFILRYRKNNCYSLIGNRAKHFYCHFESYKIIFEASKNIPIDSRRIYLSEELSDIVFWLEKFNNCVFTKKIREITANFLLTMDVSPWGDTVTDQWWYKKIYAACSQYLGNFITPKVSVIMPVFNSMNYIECSIKSVLKQTIRDFELICIDDGSTDGSYEIIKQYSENDTRISIYTQQHQYAGIARNKGLSLAKGEYITFLDSDDLFTKTALEELYNHAKTIDADVVISKARWFIKDPKISKSAQWVFNDNLLFNMISFVPLDFAENLFQISSGEPWSKIFKKSFIQQNQIKFPPLPRSEDIYFVYLAYALAKKIGVLHKETVLYRKIPNHGIESQKDLYPITSCQVRIYLKEKLEELGLYRLYKKSYINRTIDAIIYNINGCKSRKAIEEIYNIFREYVIPNLEIDMSEATYFTNKKNYKLAKKIADSINFVELWHDCFEKEINISYYAKELRMWYKKVTGNDINFNKPITFNEKIQWLKLFDSTPLKTYLSDKFLVREWIKNNVGAEYLVPLLGGGEYNNFDEINFDILPQSFVIKCTHGPNYFIVVKDKNHFDKKTASLKIRGWLIENFADQDGFELQYIDVSPKIIIEQYLECTSLITYTRYKFWCFNGKVKFVQLLAEIKSNESESLFYDLHWNKLNFSQKSYLNKNKFSKPSNLDKMVWLSQKLSKGFSFLQVCISSSNNGKIYVEGISFYPTPSVYKWSYKSIDERLGKMIRLPKIAYDISTKNFYPSNLPKPKIFSVIKFHDKREFFIKDFPILSVKRNNLFSKINNFRKKYLKYAK